MRADQKGRHGMHVRRPWRESSSFALKVPFKTDQLDDERSEIGETSRISGTSAAGVSAWFERRLRSADRPSAGKSDPRDFPGQMPARNLYCLPSCAVAGRVGGHAAECCRRREIELSIRPFALSRPSQDSGSATPTLPH